jgi:hypothetical protein
MKSKTVRTDEPDCENVQELEPRSDGKKTSICFFYFLVLKTEVV